MLGTTATTTKPRSTAARASAPSTAAAQSATATPSSDEREVWRIAKQGAVSNLRLEREPLPELQPGEALVEVRCIGLNFADVFCCLVSCAAVCSCLEVRCASVVELAF